MTTNENNPDQTNPSSTLEDGRGTSSPSVETEEGMGASIELRSEEVQEIMGRIPTRIERCGITVLFCIVAALITGCYFFQYPDTLTAELAVTNATPPVNVVARTSGRLESVRVKNGQPMAAGDTLATIQTTARPADIQRVSQALDAWLAHRTTLEEICAWMSAQSLELGEIQAAYAEFQKSAADCLDYQRLNYYPQKMAMKQRQLHKRGELEGTMRKEHAIGGEQERLAAAIFRRDSLLHRRNITAGEEYDKARQGYLQSRQARLGERTAEKQMDMQRMNEEESLLDLRQQHEQSRSRYALALHTSAEQLQASLRAWEQNYVLRSPIAGTANLMGVWSNHQNVAAGDVVFVVVPQKMAQPMGRALLPASGAGKVRTGQSVIVSINNFPDEEFGNLQGRVSSVSSVPTAEGMYIVDIRFPHGLTTIFHKRLPPTQQMLGTAKIITQNRRLTDLFIQPVKKILKNNEMMDNAQ